MAAPDLKQNIQTQPLGMIKGNHFGRYTKINDSQTYNFIISDGALVPYAGYKNVRTQSPAQIGRGIYSSSRGNIMLAVWGSLVFSIDANLNVIVRGSLTTGSGDVFMAENNNAEIAITDYVHIYVYNWNTKVFYTSTFSVSPSATEFTIPASLTSPGYISFQNGRLLVVNSGTTNWYLSQPNSAASNSPQSWQSTERTVGALQTKPDTIQACVPTPGGGNTLLVFGHNVIEQWQDVALAIFPYSRASTFNVDFGTLNASSIASLDQYIVWLAGNEQSGVTLMAHIGKETKSISTDGMDFKFANFTNPTNCTGFLYRQDGHVIYQFTFPDDNVSYIYDFNTGEFFTVTDENLNYHIARNLVFYNLKNYFVSLNGGNLYEMSSNYTDYDYGNGVIREIPRIRICPPLRLPTQRYFVMLNAGFTIENGQPNTITTYTNKGNEGLDLSTEGGDTITTEDGVLIADEYNAGATYDFQLASESVDLSMSRDGGVTFGSAVRQNMNPVGKRKSRFIYQRLGQANDATPMFRFNGFGRFVVVDDGQWEFYI